MTILTLEAAPAGQSNCLYRNCQVVVVYEDFETAHHNAQRQEYLAQRLQIPADAATSQWKVNLLDNPKLWQLAAEEVLGAEVVVVATHGDRDLPERAKEFLAWSLAQRRRREGSLVVLFDRFDNYYARTAIADFLEQTASQNGMEFLAESPEWNQG